MNAEETSGPCRHASRTEQQVSDREDEDTVQQVKADVSEPEEFRPGAPGPVGQEVQAAIERTVLERSEMRRREDPRGIPRVFLGCPAQLEVIVVGAEEG